MTYKMANFRGTVSPTGVSIKATAITNKAKAATLRPAKIMSLSHRLTVGLKVSELVWPRTMAAVNGYMQASCNQEEARRNLVSITVAHRSARCRAS